MYLQLVTSETYVMVLFQQQMRWVFFYMFVFVCFIMWNLEVWESNCSIFWMWDVSICMGWLKTLNWLHNLHYHQDWNIEISFYILLISSLCMAYIIYIYKTNIQNKQLELFFLLIVFHVPAYRESGGLYCIKTEYCNKVVEMLLYQWKLWYAQYNEYKSMWYCFDIAWCLLIAWLAHDHEVGGILCSGTSDLYQTVWYYKCHMFPLCKAINWKLLFSRSRLDQHIAAVFQVQGNMKYLNRTGKVN
jgi:hypothetical protein